MKYLLDTNICIFVINRKSEVVLQKLCECEPGEVGVSSITVAELKYGVEKSREVIRNHAALNQFLTPLEVVNFDALSAAKYGEIRAKPEMSGSRIGLLDTLIAAQALAQDLTLVTNNRREFERVPGLKIADWA